jgi:hypothetical protein
MIPAGKVTGLAPTAQSSAGDMTTSNENAMTAPGGQPVTRMPDVAAHEAPEIEAVDAGRSVLIGPGGEKRSADENTARKPVLRLGQWNEIP